MTNKGLISRIPIWLRVSGIIAVLLLAVLAGTMVLNAAGVSGGSGHGCGDQMVMVMTDHTGTDHSSPVGHGSGGGHGSAGGQGCVDATAVPR